MVETLRRCWPAHLPQPLLSSFKDASLAAAHAAAPEFARALLVGRAGGRLASARRGRGGGGINADGKRLTAVQAVEIRRAGYALGVYTINDGDVARALVGMGAQCVITDAPDVILAALG